ncbi:hypothetical protein DIS24_g12029 [Lasiodiplodia hormozganensis]|uniref:Nucleoside phosphorylase domain-containing protein n=1 Tax=Lasiodiplodia hormozganensis TaxID=869390 RepID=A0AA39WBN4_9PEZI|nr:hypothetical protein DIS24_g12029 [Lasiodiplodia hormozganensis]
MSSSKIQQSPLQKSAYTIGWICAIQTEFVAACEVLDEEHSPPLLEATGDSNAYDFGRIGDHNVVIATLPKGRYGTTSAAVVARDMLRTFPLIKLGLMVGIGGGAPSTNSDIRLGDVVVSVPGSRAGGVVHYDFGKTVQSKEFQRTGSLAAPPPILLTALSQLGAQQERRGHRIAETAAEVVKKNPRLKSKYQRPDPTEDRLYRATFVHADDTKKCLDCCQGEERELIYRPRRSSDADDPVIHYGLIASADRLMKDALLRDTLSAKEGILCFEMEAAGLMDHFPCLVIRGICDYSDTHKNDTWQGFAAVAAASYAKELLQVIPGTEVEGLRSSEGSEDERSGGGQVNNFSGSINTSGGYTIMGNQMNSGGGSMQFG